MTNEQLLAETALLEVQFKLKHWLFTHALPLWWNIGGDRTKGGFYEKLNLDCSPFDIDRRTRVAARQVYSYALAESMGYQGETTAPIRHGLRWLSGPATNAKTGLLYATLTPFGKVAREAFDLYDHAFAMLAYAAVLRTNPLEKELESSAVRIRETIRTVYAHTSRGFEESIPRSLPLKANPHMHLFEACLAWIEAGGDETWRLMAAEIADLCLEKFIHSKSGALREFFDGDWNAMAGPEGRIVEPGHHFEWAWLFLRWARITSDTRFATAAQNLISTAEEYGTDQARGVTFNEMWDDFTPRDLDARLWPQTERIKAYVKLAETATTTKTWRTAIAKVVSAAEGLHLYLNTEVAGLYRDRMNSDGTFVTEPAPASTLYHIICAIEQLLSLSSDTTGGQWTTA